eukprot:comp19722_c1_seq1/m.23487 comp19722_c1_seq1/g.23487  ORF comp19722_c1_seq1/g.23487 comp19722_c1_seq1/m.23487 type:complete len:323 (+) comp19722_c1_seq1:175-1143(+)
MAWLREMVHSFVNGWKSRASSSTTCTSAGMRSAVSSSRSWRSMCTELVSTSATVNRRRRQLRHVRWVFSRCPTNSSRPPSCTTHQMSMHPRSLSLVLGNDVRPLMHSRALFSARACVMRLKISDAVLSVSSLGQPTTTVLGRRDPSPAVCSIIFVPSSTEGADVTSVNPCSLWAFMCTFSAARLSLTCVAISAVDWPSLTTTLPTMIRAPLLVSLVNMRTKCSRWLCSATIPPSVSMRTSARICGRHCRPLAPPPDCCAGGFTSGFAAPDASPLTPSSLTPSAAHVAMVATAASSSCWLLSGSMGAVSTSPSSSANRDSSAR